MALTAPAVNWLNFLTSNVDSFPRAFEEGEKQIKYVKFSRLYHKAYQVLWRF